MKKVTSKLIGIDTSYSYDKGRMTALIEDLEDCYYCTYIDSKRTVSNMKFFVLKNATDWVSKKFSSEIKTFKK